MRTPTTREVTLTRSLVADFFNGVHQAGLKFRTHAVRVRLQTAGMFRLARMRQQSVEPVRLLSRGPATSTNYGMQPCAEPLRPRRVTSWDRADAIRLLTAKGQNIPDGLEKPFQSLSAFPNQSLSRRSRNRNLAR